MRHALKIGRKWLYVTHRWIGVVTCILFAMWFVSGVVMMYVPYPSITTGERLEAARPIDWAKVRLSPQAAIDRTPAVGGAFPSRLRLEMSQGRPVYRIVGDEGRWSVFADGEPPPGRPGAVEAAATAADFAGVDRADRVDTIMRDQWTVAGGFNPHRPLHRVRLGDPAGRVVYVSSTTGEVVQATDRAERLWNWLGSIPHWIYFTEIRTDNGFWRQVVMWTSGAGIVGAVTGMWIGLLRFSPSRRFHKGADVSPYRGWMKWHHIGGLVTGLTLTTWIFSGWLSVNPFDLFARSSPEPAAMVRWAGEGSARMPADITQLGAAAAGAREVRFIWAAGRPVAVVAFDADRRAALDPTTGAPIRIDDGSLVDRARGLTGAGALVSAARLTREDIYWYGHHTKVVLPVLRVRFDDAAQTWFHIDPMTGEVLGTMNRSDRTERWLFNFLHDFDLPVLMNYRPVWDILVWSLSIGGMVISVSGVVIGWRRLKHKGREITRRRERRRRLARA